MSTHVHCLNRNIAFIIRGFQPHTSSCSACTPCSRGRSDITAWTDDAAVHLLFSANRWEAVKSLKARLISGETLVCDRYAFSGVAFTSAKGTLDLEWCKNPDRGLPAPDAVIYLDVTSV